MNFDLDNFDSRKGAEEGFELQLSDPKTNAPVQEFITILGTDSDAYQEALRAQQRRHAERMQKARRVALPSPEEQEANVIALLVAATVSWRGDKLGKSAFSPEAAAELYKTYPPIREQVDAGISDRANFLRGGSKSSSSSPATSSS